MAYLANVENSNGVLIVKDNTGAIKSTTYTGTNYTPTSNTIIYWPLNDTTIVDASGNGYNGTNYGGSLMTDGKFGNCWEVRSGTTDYIISNSIPPAYPSFTLSLWRKRYAVGDWKAYATIGNSDTQGIGMGEASIVWFETVGRQADDIMIPASDYSNGIYNLWVHFLITKDAVANTLTAYINGQVAEVWSNFGTNPTEFATGLRLGGGSSLSNLSSAFDGEICEVIYENKSWSALDVSNYYRPRA